MSILQKLWISAILLGVGGDFVKRNVYIFHDGDFQRSDNTVYFDTGKGGEYLPIENLNEIFIFSEVKITKKLLELFAQKEITVHFFNYFGYYVGSFYPREHLNSGYMILKQAEYYLDEKKRNHLAYLFVKGAAKNIRKVLLYYKSRGKEVADILNHIETLMEKLSPDQSIEQLMALEGNIRESYYSAFDSILENKDFLFEKRSKRPPKNRLNALISFGNSIMYTIVLSEIYKTHLDPRIGYLHSTNFRRFSLNLDVAEIFKPIIVDRVILSLIGKGILTKKDFEKDMGGILLKDEGKQKFIITLEDKLKATINHRDLNRPVSYRRLIRMELYKLEKHLIGENEYEAFEAQW